MKKRLLALALCLVMVSSLLPVTAAADDFVTINSMQITASGLTQGPLWGKANVYQLNIATWSWDLEDSEEPDPTEIASFITSNNVMSEDPNQHEFITNAPVEGKIYYVHVLKKLTYDGDVFDCSFADNFSDSSGLNLPGYETRLVRQELEPELERQSCLIWLTFSLAKKHEHSWQFKQAGNTLTGTCKNCDTPPVTLSLTANSVTLPTSPFNAQLAGEKEFQTAFPNAGISKIRYDYKGSDGVWHKGVDPVAANAKAGEYQAFVEISNLPRPVEYDGVVAMAENPDGTYTADLFVKYTAVDPAVTAQTGDNRPIELMMGSVLVFSALAAAAFVFDSKRRSRQ